MDRIKTMVFLEEDLVLVLDFVPARRARSSSCLCGSVTRRRISSNEDLLLMVVHVDLVEEVLLLVLIFEDLVEEELILVHYSYLSPPQQDPRV